MSLGCVYCIEPVQGFNLGVALGIAKCFLIPFCGENVGRAMMSLCPEHYVG